MAQREIDLRFYRAAYDDVAGLTDADLMSCVARQSTVRAVNPTEFIQHTLANRLLPSDFDPVGYRINHLELWGADRCDWEAALHYLKAGSPVDAAWQRPFDAEFYQQLYLPAIATPDVNGLRAHHGAHPDAYGSLDEALLRNGWRSNAWVKGFCGRSYAIYNTLTEQLHNATQEIVHFIEHGWRDGLAVAADREFDLAYYAEFAGSLAGVSPGEAYRSWIEHGLAGGAPANAEGHLRSLALDLPCYPQGFDWSIYLDERPEAGSAARSAGRAPNRWDALAHLVERGVLDAWPLLPVQAEALPVLLLAAGDRFALAGRSVAAAHCYDRGLLCPDPPAHLLQHAADHALCDGRNAFALALYRRLRDAGTTKFRTWRNGAEAALGIGELTEAADWLLSGLVRYPRSAPLISQLMRVQQARFDHAFARHIVALRSGRTETGIGAALNEILELFLAIHRANFGVTSPLPRPSDGAPLRVVVLANQDLAQCTFYRIELKLQQLRAVGAVELQVFERSEDAAFRSAVATADLAVFYRLSSTVPVLQSIALCRALGVPTVYEVDDLIFDPAAFPDPLEAYDGVITAEQHFDLRAGITLISHAVGSCDAAITSTEGLADQLRGRVRSGSVLVHRNGLSDALAAVARASAPCQPQPPGAPITLFYGSGTLAHGADFRDLLAPALGRLMTDHPDVRLVVCGHVNAADLAARFTGRVECIAPIADRDAYLSQLLGVDINLAVLRHSCFNDCKSEIKWLEAAAFCVPSVVSDVAGYRETLRDGIDLIRVPPDPTAWYSALRSLVLEPGRRSAIGAAARDRALELYSPRGLGRSLAAGLLRLAQPAAPVAQPRRRTDVEAAAVQRMVPARPRRPRVLLANVFFPPQARGGATRVVRDQAAELLAHYADRFEVGVLCGNDEATGAYQVEAYRWHGAPVWSVGCPHREHMDWIPFDPLMAVPIDAVLDRFKPDLVHAHCIQRLSATMLERVAARGIPYVVTAHDAWWVSDHQFLTDEQDQVRMPWDAERFETAHNPHTREQSRARRLRLLGVLGAAAAILTVSEAFAAIYRRAGVAKAVAVPNGLPELPPLESVPPVAGRVRLAHLGGVTAHKGYFLLRQALGRGRFSNLDLLVTDHAMMPGEERHEMWGATPVRIVSMVPQDGVGALYGSFDVLCALSLWPESYGLVAREAMHYGRWVLTSSRGAIGDDVVPQQNGWVVDVADPSALPRVLAALAAHPERYTVPPAVRAGGRTMVQQVAEMVAIYDSILQPKRAELPLRRAVPPAAASGKGAASAPRSPAPRSPAPRSLAPGSPVPGSPAPLSPPPAASVANGRQPYGARHATGSRSGLTRASASRSTI